MDQIALVERQIEDGRKLLEHLEHTGFRVAAAFWVNATDADRWCLYIASPVADEEGRAAAYRLVYPAIRQMPEPFWIEPYEVKLIEQKSPVAQAVLAALRGHHGRGPIRYGGARLGPMNVEAAYLYPTPTVVAEDRSNGRAE